MSERTIKELFEAKITMEGAGVRLHRVFSQPEVPKFDPFLLLDNFGSKNPDDYMRGFPWHPHRGIETVTYMKSGEVEHQDSLGNKGVIKEGDVQWMTAGSGIVHQEMPQIAKDTLSGLQLWVNLPKEKKMVAPTYRGILKKDVPQIESGGVSVRLISGKFKDAVGPAKNLHVDVRYMDVDLEGGSEFRYELPKHFTAFVYVYDGEVQIGNENVIKEKFAALTNDGDVVSVTTPTKSSFIFVAGEPIGEPVAWGGPIVMNTEAELQQAFWEFQNNEFIK